LQVGVGVGAGVGVGVGVDGGKMQGPVKQTGVGVGVGGGMKLQLGLRQRPVKGSIMHTGSRKKQSGGSIEDCICAFVPIWNASTVKKKIRKYIRREKSRVANLLFMIGEPP
jgi:hypothetical protein